VPLLTQLSTLCLVRRSGSCLSLTSETHECCAVVNTAVHTGCGPLLWRTSVAIQEGTRAAVPLLTQLSTLCLARRSGSRQSLISKAHVLLRRFRHSCPPVYGASNLLFGLTPVSHQGHALLRRC
jgi:hypothetical protein